MSQTVRERSSLRLLAWSRRIRSECRGGASDSDPLGAGEADPEGPLAGSAKLDVACEPATVAEIVTGGRPAAARKLRDSRITSLQSSARKTRCGSASGYFLRISFSAAVSASKPVHQ